MSAANLVTETSTGWGLGPEPTQYAPRIIETTGFCANANKQGCAQIRKRRRVEGGLFPGDHDCHFNERNRTPRCDPAWLSTYDRAIARTLVWLLSVLSPTSLQGDHFEQCDRNQHDSLRIHPKSQLQVAYRIRPDSIDEETHAAPLAQQPRSIDPTLEPHPPVGAVSRVAVCSTHCLRISTRRVQSSRPRSRQAWRRISELSCKPPWNPRNGAPRSSVSRPPRPGSWCAHFAQSVHYCAERGHADRVASRQRITRSWIAVRSCSVCPRAPC